LILIGPFEQSLKGFKPSDFIDRDATYSEILQQAKRAKIGLEKNLREAIKKEEKFSETARNILSQIGVFEFSIDGFRSVNFSWFAVKFEATGDVHGLSPQIIRELLFSNDSCHGRASVHADTYLHGNFQTVG
jgi:hypothetical protein